MSSKLRRQIAYEAARMLKTRQESEYIQARQKAAQRICQGWVQPDDLPSNAEICEELRAQEKRCEGEPRAEELRAMRLTSLRMMRILCRFRPRLMESVVSGEIGGDAKIELHVFAESATAIRTALEEAGLKCVIEHKQVVQEDEVSLFTHVRVRDRFAFELTVFPTVKSHSAVRSAMTGRPIERASIAELEQFLTREYPALDLSEAVTGRENGVDRFQIFRGLLLPLEDVQQDLRRHPEGDVLYHSLQVFDLAREELPYDEEFLLAALLHDVGKGIDAHDSVAAGLESLAGFITERTSWLIEYLPEAHQLREGLLGMRARKRLAQSENYEDLLLLAECDLAGRQRGVACSDVDEALDYLRELGATFG